MICGNILQVPVVSYNKSDQEVKYVPTIFPKGPKVVDPFEKNFKNKHQQCTVVKDVQNELHQFYSFPLPICYFWKKTKKM